MKKLHVGFNNFLQHDNLILLVLSLHELFEVPSCVYICICINSLQEDTQEIDNHGCLLCSGGES